MKVHVYEVTWSRVPTVKVGTFIVDTVDWAEEHGDRRGYGLFNKTTGDFEDGWSGVVVARACKHCYRDHRLVRPHKHDGPHGDGPALIPTRYNTPAVTP